MNVNIITKIASCKNLKLLGRGMMKMKDIFQKDAKCGLGTIDLVIITLA